MNKINYIRKIGSNAFNNNAIANIRMTTHMRNE